MEMDAVGINGAPPFYFGPNYMLYIDRLCLDPGTVKLFVLVKCFSIAEVLAIISH
jgi:hypothetical protein